METRTLLGLLLLIGCASAPPADAPDPPPEPLALTAPAPALPALEPLVAADAPARFQAEWTYLATAEGYVEWLRFGQPQGANTLDALKAARAAFLASPDPPPPPPPAPGAVTLTVTPGAKCATLAWGQSSVPLNLYEPGGVPTRVDVTCNGGPVATLRGDTATLPDADGTYTLAIVSYPAGTVMWWPAVTVARTGGVWTTR